MKGGWLRSYCLLLAMGSLGAASCDQSRPSDPPKRAEAHELAEASKKFYDQSGGGRIDGSNPAQLAAGSEYRDAVRNHVANASTAAALYPDSQHCVQLGLVHWTYKMDCHADIVKAANRLVPKSRGGDELRSLLGDMFEPFVRVRTKGEGGNAMSEQGVLQELQARFAVERAAILTNSRLPLREAPGASKGDMFAALSRDPRFTQRWASIRRADCAAYQVPNCEERLDGAMRRMLLVALDEKRQFAIMDEPAPPAE